MKMYDLRLNFHWSSSTGSDNGFAQSHYVNQWWLGYRRKYASHDPKELNNMVPVERNHQWLQSESYTLTDFNAMWPDHTCKLC